MGKKEANAVPSVSEINDSNSSQLSPGKYTHDILFACNPREWG